MRFGETDIPDQILLAQQKNNLVIFAGAGVSYCSPANAPPLDKVTKDFLETHVTTFRPVLDSQGKIQNLIETLQDVERLRKSLCRQYFQRVYSKLKKPSELHHHLVRLFCEDQFLRIITTNYDSLFTIEVNKSRKSSTQIYNYPNLTSQVIEIVSGSSSFSANEPEATPDIDSEVNGIFHLHGSSLSEPENLVLTRKDFGRAYLREDSAAATFLRQLPKHFHLVLVGFSGNDPIVKDFIAANCNKNNTFAICPEDHAEGWESMEITPLYYPVGSDENKHLNLTIAIEEWANETRKQESANPNRASARE